MRIEILMARGWKMWIDGKRTGAFDIGEDEYGGWTFKGVEPLVNLKFDLPEPEWADDHKPTMAVGGVVTEPEGMQIAHYFRVNQCVYGDPNGKDVAVKLWNGETHELDEITAYVELVEMRQWWQEERAGA